LRIAIVLFGIFIFRCKFFGLATFAVEVGRMLLRHRKILLCILNERANTPVPPNGNKSDQRSRIVLVRADAATGGGSLTAVPDFIASATFPARVCFPCIKGESYITGSAIRFAVLGLLHWKRQVLPEHLDLPMLGKPLERQPAKAP